MISERNPTFPYAYGLQKELGLKHPLGDYSSAFIIELMEENFDLVIASTYFDEGLCYLRETLCWQFSDIVYFEQNQRSNKPVYTAEEKMRLNSILQDVIPVYIDVFNYFETKFRDQILNRQIKLDVTKLLDLKAKKQEECLQPGNSSNPTNDPRLVPKNQPRPIRSYELKINSTECLLLAMPEPSLTSCLKNKEMRLECDLTPRVKI